MSEYLIQKSTLDDIGAAIRAKTGKSAAINPLDMPAEILAIETGGGLNFTVVGGTSQPSSPAENTIWVNTDTAITGYIFSATEPANPTEGLVWIAVGIDSPGEFNALTENTIQIYPVSAKQYASGTWKSVTAMNYLNGSWVTWVIHLYKYGVTNTELTGGFYGQEYNDGLYYPSTTLLPGRNATYTTKSKINLTGVNTVYARVLSHGTVEDTYFRLQATSSAYNGDSISTSALTAYEFEDGPFNGVERIAALDVSALSGEYYLGYAWGVYGAAEANRGIGGYVYELWME